MCPAVLPLDVSLRPPKSMTSSLASRRPIDVEGVYPEVKTVRKAGTHRLVHLTHRVPTEATEPAHSNIAATALGHATRQFLRVARAAYIYLIDLVQDQQDEFEKRGMPAPCRCSICREPPCVRV
ncbi:hypothetical protein FHX49_000652 [Microbacterium endophyticum]|uniref:Uncharacterized protein n=1 Tax=Microbacterium endophyticum TaxID=1526412 RepID=A0A7W4V1H9_9MICO|nr:hypothetical protein [Microbacterium endophyticum]NIK37349.1 hypothetical protein [Microbacterium endophyticum]